MKIKFIDEGRDADVYHPYPSMHTYGPVKVVEQMLSWVAHVIVAQMDPDRLIGPFVHNIVPPHASKVCIVTAHV